ncbi:UDP-N-acetylmuramoyl-tripeptide--D-alanyl-D-alanine ligase [Companilactobacillus sp. RD055328]|uniref:UDP-N-acetylmuramoyl-tripeptide--D-alanyl-D- alanine ligase n=1 Tax=Companilactobacillus sp. RD055328 TaxID=2916634 RepID=UPI001FC84B52|nr:UDP-N-acetylmuramoyl-tripeptide--D-alanyl-D-alanine ligase [Companilactobacillus sp. RD055328]GKQ42299.1 UDP-N-acetylmuramoyl-tripeptide--D-alanyl-D-alanine ligase [Companilactobacillus sp. RD055328]
MKLTVNELVSALHLDQEIKNDDAIVTNACFDSRKAIEGSLFIPLNGDRDGHEFIDKAQSLGATASLWQKDHEIPEGVTIPLILVDDVLTALQDLSKYYLNKVNPKVVAVTGSNGKTTTKDMIASILKSESNVVYTYANFNNEIGVPVTVLNMETSTEVLVVELGMDRPGQIHKLSEIVQPDIAVITMIGEAHIEFFGTRDKIADAKMEIVDFLREDGIFIYNGDDPLLRQKAESVQQAKVTFGFNEDNDICPLEQNSKKSSTDFKLNIYPDTDFVLPLMGDYNVNNAMAAIGVGKVMNIPVIEIVDQLQKFVPTKNRTEWKKAFNGADILSDVYNSNPTAVIDVLENLKKIECNGRRIVVLGDMLELGDQSQVLHESIAQYLNPQDFQEVYLIGSDMKYLKQKLAEKYEQSQIKYFEKSQLEELSMSIKVDLQPADLIMLKASNGIHLNQVLEQIEM